MKEGGHMKNIKTFLKKNAFFVFLLSVVLFIIIALGIYKYVINKADATTSSKDPTTDHVVSEAKKSAEITFLEGEYNQRTQTMRVNWNISQSNEIYKVVLYLNNNYIDEVSSFSYYDLLMGSYRYPTGTNEIKLIMTTNDGKVVEKKTNVFVHYLISAAQSVQQKIDATFVTLTYVYEKINPIKVPSIVTDGRVPDGAQYINTTYVEKDGLITAQTTYAFYWSDRPIDYQQFVIRWKFNDIKESRDFQASKGTPPKARSNP